MIRNPEPKRSLDDIDAAIRKQQQTREDLGNHLSQDDMASAALAFFLDNVAMYQDDQLAAIYNHIVGEVAQRGLEEEIIGEVVDVAGISLDEEMNEMIKMVRTMRANLAKQTALGKAVSNREIRETLSACITATKALTSHQKSIRTIERQRVLESSLIETLGTISEELQTQFQELFRERLMELSE